MRLTSLPYSPDSAAIFETIAAEPWAVFLDSGIRHTHAGSESGHFSGRFDILAARPFITLQTRGDSTEIRQAGVSTFSCIDPFDLLRRYLAVDAEPATLPFSGGAIGYFGYDLAGRIEPLASHKVGASAAVPDMAVGIYDWAVVVDHEQQASWLVGAERDEQTTLIWQDLVALFSAPVLSVEQCCVNSPFRVGSVTCSFTPDAYRRAFARIQGYISAGDCYQVNLAQRFSASVAGDHWLGYQTLRRLNPAPYSAYLNLPDVKILSSSPERFLSVRQGVVETRPIKGTRARAAKPEADIALARELQVSEKDRAENLMIVDLLRNDLGKVCTPGSVEVPRLFEIETFATVHHLVSTITGRLAEGCDAIELLRAAFPGGSITGAPKLRAMQIIDELEPDRRGVYCGAIGWLGFNGDMDSNIAIRTLVSANNQIEFWAGGGIVADSQVDAEYQECMDKAEALLRLMCESGLGNQPSLNEGD
jgi:para-aminobenzoate synthetase component 1